MFLGLNLFSAVCIFLALKLYQVVEGKIHQVASWLFCCCYEYKLCVTATKYLGSGALEYFTESSISQIASCEPPKGAAGSFPVASPIVCAELTFWSSRAGLRLHITAHAMNSDDDLHQETSLENGF